MQQRSVHPIGPSELEDAGVSFATFTTLETITESDGVYQNASGYIGRARADASSTMHAIGLAHRGIASGQPGRVVTHGPYRSDNLDGSGYIGRNAYISPSTAGALLTTPPTGSGQIVQAIGFWGPTRREVYVSLQGATQRGGTL